MPTDNPLALGAAVKLRETVANIVARSKWGSLAPDIGMPNDVPSGVDEQDYRAADAILSLLSTEREVRLEAALRVARGWVVTCSESATARRDLKKIDAALGWNE